MFEKYHSVFQCFGVPLGLHAGKQDVFSWMSSTDVSRAERILHILWSGFQIASLILFVTCLHGVPMWLLPSWTRLRSHHFCKLCQLVLWECSCLHVVQHCATCRVLGVPAWKQRCSHHDRHVGCSPGKRHPWDGMIERFKPGHHFEASQFFFGRFP